MDVGFRKAKRSALDGTVHHALPFPNLAYSRLFETLNHLHYVKQSPPLGI